MFLSRALRIESKEVVAFVGGGGKTTAMFRLAAELAAPAGRRRVIVTTTTRMFAAQAAALGFAPLRFDGARDFVGRVKQALEAHPTVVLTGENADGDKVAGLPPGVIDELAALDHVDAILVEADGARRRPFKAPAAHEPVLPNSVTLLVPMVGASVIGAPLDEEHVHRPDLVARLAGAHIGQVLTADSVARVIAHPEGGLKGKPERARVVVLVNQVSDQSLASARTVAGLLLRNRDIEAVALGGVQDAGKPVREVHRRVAAIVLAAGTGTRMGAQVKQLLPWRGKTLIENAVEIATHSNVQDVIVVLGARADTIRPAIQDQPVRIALNPDWSEGHSTSIRVGLQALAPEIDAAVFINADQPLLSAPVVDAIVQRYRDTDASIVAPRYAGKRGSPVLFRRAHFAELMGLHGEEGGREVLAKYPVEQVDFADANASLDVDTPEDYAELVQRYF